MVPGRDGPTSGTTGGGCASAGRAERSRARGHARGRAQGAHTKPAASRGLGARPAVLALMLATLVLQTASGVALALVAALLAVLVSRCAGSVAARRCVLAATIALLGHLALMAMSSGVPDSPIRCPPRFNGVPLHGRYD
eukprot:1868507-Alexandrium_andersonii.AAC.1